MTTLLTLTQAVSVGHGFRSAFTEESFYRWVAEGRAPAPVERRGGVPLWAAAQVEEWSRERLPALVDEHTRALVVATSASYALRQPMLSPLHELELDASLPTHEAVARLEVQLQRLGIALGQLLRRLETRAAELHAEPAVDALPVGSLRRFRQRRAAAKLDRLLRSTEEMQAAVDTDADLCGQWLSSFLAWGEAEKIRRSGVVHQREVEPERRARVLDLERVETFASSVDYVRADPRRFLRSTSHKITSATLLDRITGGEEVDPRDVSLDGSDSGFRWRSDTGTGQARPDGPDGSWRISYLGTTGELYAVSRDHRVVVLGRLPREASSDQVWRWIGPLEARMGERNSLALPWQAFQEQERAGFPLLESSDYLLGSD